MKRTINDEMCQAKGATIKVILIVALLATFCNIIFSQENVFRSAPNADIVLERHAKAIGINDRLRRFRIVRISGKIVPERLKVIGKFEFGATSSGSFGGQLELRPRLFGIGIAAGSRRKLTFGYHDGQSWLTGTAGNAKGLTLTQLKFFEELFGNISGIEGIRKRSNSITAGTEKFQGIDCHKIISFDSIGRDWVEYFRISDGLLYGGIYPFRMEGNILNICVTYTQYVQRGGYLLPDIIVMKTANDQYSINVEEVEYGVGGEVDFTSPDGALRLEISETQANGVSNLPTVDELKDSYTKAICATGGVNRSGRIKITGSYTSLHPAEKVFTGGFTLTRVNPNSTLLRVNCKGYGEFERICDGTKAWKVEPGKGKVELSGLLLQQEIRKSNFLDDIRRREAVIYKHVIGEEMFEGVKCLKVLMVHQSGEAWSEYYDAQSFLLRGRSFTLEPNKELIIEVFSDFKIYSGKMFPTKHIYRNHAGQEEKFEAEKIEVSEEGFRLESNVLPQSHSTAD